MKDIKNSFVVVLNTDDGVKYLAGDDPMYLSDKLDNWDTGDMIAHVFKSRIEASRHLKVASGIASSNGQVINKKQVIPLDLALNGVFESRNKCNVLLSHIRWIRI